MIGSLRGELLELAPVSDSAAEALVDVAGVGYSVTVSPATAAALGQPGDQVRLAVHTHVREMAITLYGFVSAEERRCFDLLLGAHGVGPALALAILGVHPPEVLAKIVASEDVDSLTLVPGVGKKTAARLLVELQSRLGDMSTSSRGASPPPAGGSRSAAADVADALAGLGYAPDEVRSAIQAVGSDAGAEEMLRAALRHLGRPR